MEPVKVRHSQLDGTQKFIFSHKQRNVEYVYIDNRTGKDIVCVPSQTGCNLGCTFCHLTMRKDPVVGQIDPDFSVEAIATTLKEASKRSPRNKTLLISFMGAGEPLLSLDYVTEVMDKIHTLYRGEYTKVRFALASIVPSANLLEQLKIRVQASGLPLKIHWSLHHPVQSERAKHMPKAASIAEVLPALLSYREGTGNPVEIHYTVFEGNDSRLTAHALADLCITNDLPVKFLQFSERADKVLARSTHYHSFPMWVEAKGAQTELYTPPGHDILGACGEFESGE